MTVRPPAAFGNAPPSDVLFDALGHEILAEKASALGRAGDRAAACLSRLRDHAAGQAPTGAAYDSQRSELVKAAADAVYAFFVQRELCGLRRHEAVIREMQIPREVLVRLGAK